MKKFNIVGLALSGLVLASIASTGVANAAVEGSPKTSQANVTITDQTDPNKAKLVLMAVPVAFSFTTTVQDKAYAMDGTISTGKVDGQSYNQDDMVVSNDASSAKWTLTASVVDNKISGTPASTKTATDFPVSSFVINKNELVGTSANQIVMQNGDAAILPAGMTTGQMTKQVTAVHIGFNDANNVLANGDKLAGTINYVLANTSAAL